MTCRVFCRVKGRLDFGPGEEEGKISLSASVHLSLEIGLCFTKKKPAEWKRGRIPSSAPRLAVRNRGHQGPLRWPRGVSALRSLLLPWGDRAVQPAPSAGNRQSPSGFCYPSEMQRVFPAHREDGPIPCEHALASAASRWAATTSGPPAGEFWELCAGWIRAGNRLPRDEEGGKIVAHLSTEALINPG